MKVTDLGELFVVDRDRYSNHREISVQPSEHFVHEARLAATLIEKWGLVAAAPDGESSDGRQKLRDLSPSEIVDKACNTASLAVAEFRKRGWIIKFPKELIEGDRDGS